MGLPVRARYTVLLLIALLTACSSRTIAAKDPVAVLKQARDRSLASPAATYRGTMTAGGRDLVVLAGSVDFARRRTDTIVSPADGALTYPFYEIRFVDGWNYIQITTLRRPAEIHADTQWVAYQRRPQVVPIPDRVIPPALPIEVLEWPRTQPIAAARFVGSSSGPATKVAIRFRDAQFKNSEDTYTIGDDGTIEAVSIIDGNDQGVALIYDYTKSSDGITAPAAHVQVLTRSRIG